MPAPGARAGPESSSRLQLLEFSAFLENYLWPNFAPEKSSTEHLMSTVSCGKSQRERYCFGGQC